MTQEKKPVSEFVFENSTGRVRDWFMEGDILYYYEGDKLRSFNLFQLHRYFYPLPDTQTKCPTIPYASKSEEILLNNTPVMLELEYVVPVNCSESIVFKRKLTDGGSVGDLFDVYYRKGDLEFYLFEHKGLLWDIAGGGFWEVVSAGDTVHLSLTFGDIGARASWDYYFSRENKKLLLGLTGSLNVLTGKSRKYEL